jgi:hypothetical protein
MSATHKRLLPESDRIPYFRNPSNPATSVCAAGLPTDRGELPVFVSLSAPPVLTSEDDTCGASPRVRGRTLPPIAGKVTHCGTLMAGGEVAGTFCYATLSSNI